MSAEVTNIKLYGIEFHIQGNYVKGEDESIDCPGSPSEFEIETIEHKGEELQDVLDESVIKELTEKSREYLDEC